MTIQHHPDDTMLLGFAAATLDLGQHTAVATHLVSCAKCRQMTRDMECVGGAVLAGLPAEAMAPDALARVAARLSESDERVTTEAEPTAPDVGVSGLPRFVRGYSFGDWQWIAPRVHICRITLPVPSATRIFLLRSGAGTKMLQHSHTGIEMTCVLSGAFRHDGGYFGPGDFDLGDGSVDHRPLVEDSVDCVCFVAMQGDLRLNGLLGRMMQPFVRL